MTREAISAKGAAHRVHGLDGSWADGDWPAWTSAEVDDLLRDYDGLGRVVEITAVSPRPFSAAACVRTTEASVFVKRHSRAVRRAAWLAEEHRFAEWLAARTPLVMPPLQTRSGHTAVERSEWVSEAFPIAPGRDLYAQAMSWTPYLCVEHARAAGIALGQLHVAAREFAAPARSTAPLVTSFSLIPATNATAAFHAYLAARPVLAHWLSARNAEADFARCFVPHHQSMQHQGLLTAGQALRPLWTQNDWHGSNLMWSNLPCSGESADARVTAVIDFGLADRTCAAHDVATALERSIIDWIRLSGRMQANLEQAAALLAGYEEVVRLTKHERRAIAAMLPIVHCEFALSETDYFLTVLRDEARAQLAWQEYFVGHCEWFETAEGRRLMDWMQAWAVGDR